MKKGVLLLNLGSPDSPEPGDVKRYLNEFLSDPYVIDIPYIFRMLLLKLFILPFRPQKSSEAYKKIWGPRGSPLVYHSEDLQLKVQKNLGPDYVVDLAMRYGKLSIQGALERLHAQELSSLVIIPLYPQYSYAATESSIVRCKKLLKKMGSQLPVRFLEYFYDHPDFIESVLEQGRAVLAKGNYDHVMFSFHGVPERQIRRCDQSSDHCLNLDSCCDKISAVNAKCYRAQCYQTARVLAKRLSLKDKDYTVAFQSRLGRTPWIRPYTDVLLKELADRSVRRIALFSPSFVADCLETLEEIEIRGRADFKNYGGEELTLVPSLNSSDTWARAVAELARS